MKQFLLSVFTVFSTIATLGQMPGWSHVVPVLVQEHSGTNVYDYQLAITINTEDPVALGHMLATGDDIRFTDSCSGGTPFSYWIESGMNTAATKIWVRIDSLQAGRARSVYMHYGNVSAGPVSAIGTTFVGPHSATDSVDNGSAGGVGNSQRGFRFYPNEDILVTSFGKREPTGTTRYITLFDNTTQGIIQQIQVSGPAGQYSYGNLSEPIWLTENTQYLLELYQESGDGYYYGTSSQIGQHLTYLDMRYCNSCNQNTFPGNFLNNIHYGYPDLWYYSKNNVTPAPTYSFEPMIVQIDPVTAICSGDTSEVQLDVQGGQGPLTITWAGNDLLDAAAQHLIANPPVSSTYQVEITDACGYTIGTTADITVNPLPVQAVVSDAAILCEGEYAILSVSGDSLTFFWNDGSANDTLIVMPAVTTEYSVLITDTNLCSYSAHYTQPVNIPVMVSRDTILCFGEALVYNGHTYSESGAYTDTIIGVSNCDSIVTTNLTVQGPIDPDVQWVGTSLVADVGGDSYQWYDCSNGLVLISGATGPVFEVTANGSYTVGVSTGVCTEFGDCIAVTTVGMDENDQIENISVFPNPNGGRFTVRSSLSQKVLVTDAVGQEIVSVNLSAGQAREIDLQQATAGIYFVISRAKVVRIVVE